MQSLLHFPVRSLVLLIWLVSCVPCPVFAARRDEKKAPLPAPPPQAVEQKVEVPRGKTVNIPLKIYGSQRETLRFLIRSPVEHGTITAPKTLGKESAMVTYTPPTDYDITEDQFTYAVGNSAGVSAAAAVSIRILDEPPLLAIPGSLQFPPILAGKKTPQEFEISNRGGGLAVGVIRVDPPWMLDGKPEYRLPAGMSRTVRVLFAPTESGNFRSEIRFSSHPAHTTALNGEAKAPLTVTPAQIELTHPADDPRRSAESQVTNNTEEPQTVALRADEGLTVEPQSITIEPGSAATFRVGVAPENLVPLEGFVHLTTPEINLSIPAKGARVKPVLRAAARELRLERPSNGGPPTGTLTVENAGGEEGYWRWELRAPFMTLETEARIASGAKLEIPVQLEASASGSYRTVLKLIGEQQTLEIVVLGEAVLAEAAPPRSPAASAKPTRAATSSKLQLTPVAAVAREPEPVEIPYPYKRIGIRERHPDRVVLVWLAEQYPPEAYRVEMQHLSLGPKKELKIDWLPVPQQKVEGIEKKGVRAELTGLRPGQLYTLRLTTSQPGTTERTEVGGIEVTTPPSAPLVEVTLLKGLLLLLAIFVGFAVWQRRRRS